MVTMNIVGAGFKPAPSKNKKDIRKIVVQHCRNQKTPLFPPFARGDTGGCNETFQTCPHETCPRPSGEWGKKFLQGNTIS